MKFSLVVTLVVLGGASAFAPPAGSRASLLRRSVLSEPDVAEMKNDGVETKDAKKDDKDASAKNAAFVAKRAIVDVTGMPELSIEQDTKVIASHSTSANDKIEP